MIGKYIWSSKQSTHLSAQLICWGWKWSFTGNLKLTHIHKISLVYHWHWMIFPTYSRSQWPPAKRKSRRSWWWTRNRGFGQTTAQIKEFKVYSVMQNYNVCCSNPVASKFTKSYFKQEQRTKERRKKCPVFLPAVVSSRTDVSNTISHRDEYKL